MHSSIPFPGEYTPLFDVLSEPLYPGSLRNRQRQARLGEELSLERGYQLHPGDFAGHPHIDILLSDLRQFLATAMELVEHPGGVPFHLRKTPPPPGQAESDGLYECHTLEVSPEQVTLSAPDLDGLRRALYRVEDEMRLRRAPILPLGTHTRGTRLRTRISRNPLAPYRWLSGWELNDSRDFYPETYLRRIARAGVNALWVPGLFRTLIASSILPELGPSTHQLARLRDLVAKAAPHGIRIYLFCVEPRVLPHGHPALHRYPELIGAGRSLCISQHRVQEYLRDACHTLTREVPDLAGVINIFSGERCTSCWGNATYVQECPSCRKRTQAEVYSTVLNTMIEGLTLGNPHAELLAWTYLMASSTESLPIAPMLDVMNATDPRVIWIGNYEHGGSKVACGREVAVHEYSLSCPGPSPHFTSLVDHGLKMGRTLHAKLQMGNSYELSSLPWITAPGIIVDKVTTALQLGVTGAMLGWIVGGLPGPMLRAAGEAAFANETGSATTLLRVAAIHWGEANAATVVRAWEAFASAWKAYPFHNALLYWGPITRAPAYPLHLEKESRLATPYNWGLDRQRHRQPFENHPQRWLGHYTSGEIVATLRDMAACWEEGLILLRRVASGAESNPETARELRIAESTRLQLLSAANIYEFNTLRLQLLEEEGNEHPLSRMAEIARDELANTESMRLQMAAEPWIGFQSEIFAYSYSLPMLYEKRAQLALTLQRLCHWLQHGVERWVLEKEIATVEHERPDDWPDLFGD